MIRAKYLNSLREELNRDRAYVRSTKFNIDRGFNVSPVSKIIASSKWYNAGFLKKAIKKIKNAKPRYKWEMGSKT